MGFEAFNLLVAVEKSYLLMLVRGYKDNQETFITAPPYNMEFRKYSQVSL